MNDDESKREQILASAEPVQPSKFTETVERCGPLATSILAASKPPAPLQPGMRCRERIRDHNGYRSRRRFGTVAQVKDHSYGVLFDGVDKVLWLAKEDVVRITRKYPASQWLARENKRLMAVIAKVVEARRALEAASLGRSLDAWDYYEKVSDVANEALEQYELETR